MRSEFNDYLRWGWALLWRMWVLAIAISFARVLADPAVIDERQAPWWVNVLVVLGGCAWLAYERKGAES